ncbi:MAG: NAD-dependent epimerase/dehydratase family protein [Prolixibacteraceae bacterium]
MRKILVTGGAGMIGSNLVKRLVEAGDEVYVIDNLWRGKLEFLNDEAGNPVIPLNTHFFKLDLSQPDIAEVVMHKVEYVVHLADIVAGISYVFNNQCSLFRQNNLINSHMITTVRKFKETVKGFIYVGTACSFPLTRQNSLDVIPLKEEELYPALPESAYGWSKLMGQYETELLEKETGIPTCTLMFHNVYGSPCDFGERSQVIPALIRKAINYPEEPFNVWGSGEQGRAFIHVNDIVEGIVLGLEKGWGHGHIQLGPSVCTSIKEIAENVVAISGKEIDVFYDTTKPEGDKARSADYTKAKTILGWEPKVKLMDGLREQYNWIRKQIEKKDGLVFANLDGQFEMTTSHGVGKKKVLIHNEKGNSGLIQVAFGMLQSGETVGSHRHPTMEEYYVVNYGKGTITVNGVDFPCQSGTFLKIPANAEHSIQAKEEIRFTYWGVAI